MRYIKALYWNNVKPNIVERQRFTFSALGHVIDQANADRVPHGTWLTETLRALAADDAILFVDIDCVPLDAEIIEEAFRAAESGRIFAVAQTASHLDPSFIYAAPSFLCLSRSTWARLGEPDLMHDATYDPAGRLTASALAHGVPVDLLFPSFCLVPKWHLANRGCYGVGTFYEGRVFHLFESRREPGWNFAFDEVCHSVVAGRPIDYLGLYARARSWSTWATLVRGRLARRRDRIARSIRKRVSRRPAPT